MECVVIKGRRGALSRQAGAWSAIGPVSALLAGLLLGGCQTVAEAAGATSRQFDQPIDWWHGLQGGVIAQERPPPPGADDPFPNLSTIPPKPTPPDAATRQALSARLTGERDRARREALRDPIPPFSPPAIPDFAPARDTLEGAAAPPPSAPAPSAPAGPSARFAAAEALAPAAAGRPTTPLDSGPVAPAIAAAAAPVPPPRPPPPPLPVAGGGGALPPAAPRAESGREVIGGPVPAIPPAAPALPQVAGIPALAATPDAAPRAPLQVAVSFVPGSALIRPDSADALRELVGKRGDGRVQVLGGGDAGPGLLGQAEALPLAWRRAQAMRDALVADGVPASAMQIDAAAVATGGLVRLMD